MIKQRHVPACGWSSGGGGGCDDSDDSGDDSGDPELPPPPPSSSSSSYETKKSPTTTTITTSSPPSLTLVQIKPTDQVDPAIADLLSVRDIGEIEISNQLRSKLVELLDGTLESMSKCNHDEDLNDILIVDDNDGGDGSGYED